MDFFIAITDYSSMLNRIGITTFFAWLGVLWWADASIQFIRDQVPQLTVKVPYFDWSVPSTVFLMTILLAIICRAIKLHDRLSDLFGIRRRFDVQEILLPMASAAGVPLTLEQQEKVPEKRRTLMGAVFYKYVSSTLKEPVIDKHTIIMALDQWSWYWIVVETCAVAVFGSILFGVFRHYAESVSLLTLCLLGIWAAQGLRSACAKYARDEVKLVLEDGQRKGSVADTFRAL